MGLPLVAGAALLLLDQWSKRAARLHAGHSIAGGRFFRIRCVIHASNFYRRDLTTALLLFVWFLSLLSAILLHRLGSWFQADGALVGLGLALGGAAGNLIDVVQHRYVVDFIGIGWWPVFNFADVGIVAGLALAFWC